MPRLPLALILVIGLVAAACGSEPGKVTTISNPTSTGGDPKIAGAAATAFGNDLFVAVRDDKNSVISPVSVAIALAMLEPGATGDSKAQLDHALHIDDPAAFHASMTALRASLEAAKPSQLSGNDQKPGELSIAVANAAYLQRDYPVKTSYTDTLSRYYGPLLRLVDFKNDSDGAVNDINKFVDDGTSGHIPKVLDDLSRDTVFALVNALYLKASWLEPFKTSATKTEPFTRLDDSTLDTKLMHGQSNSSLGGDGWVAARKFYTNRLAAEFVLPDKGRFDEVAGKLRSVFADFGKDSAYGADLAVPKLTTRFEKELKPALNKLGITSVYDAGHLLGIADDNTLIVDKAIHATYLAMDEEGTEAAAATIVTGIATSGRDNPPTPVAVILDRPFFFRIVDSETGATLFIGQITDPTA